MTDLHWVKPPKMLQQLAHAAVPNGTLVAVQGNGYKKHNAPETVRVLRAYTPFVKTLRSMAAMPKYADLGDTFLVRWVTEGTKCIRSENFPLTARGFLHTQRWICQDPAGTFSPPLRTSRFVDVSVMNLAPEVKGVKLISLRARVAAPKDPMIGLSLVTPNEPHDLCSFSDVLKSFTREAFIDSDLTTAAARSFFRKETRSYLKEPSGWQGWIDRPQLTLGAGEEAEIQIHIIPGAPGRFPLAVVAKEENSSQFSVSNIVVVEQSTDGELELLFGEGHWARTEPHSATSPRSRYRLQVEADVFNEDSEPRRSPRYN